VDREAIAEGLALLAADGLVPQAADNPDRLAADGPDPLAADGPDPQAGDRRPDRLAADGPDPLAADGPYPQAGDRRPDRLAADGPDPNPLAAARGDRDPGPYQLQAAIAACHAGAPSPAATDWPRISALYTALSRRTPSAVVRLNRAVAIAMADGPAAGLVLVDDLEHSGRLAGYHLLPATSGGPAAPSRPERGCRRRLPGSPRSRGRRRRPPLPAPPARRGHGRCRGSGRPLTPGGRVTSGGRVRPAARPAVRTAGLAPLSPRPPSPSLLI